MIRVKFECDSVGNHACSISEICRVRTEVFDDSIDALHFIGECTSCLSTNLKYEAPELFIHENINDDEMIDTGEIHLNELEDNLEINNIFSNNF